MGLAKVTIVKMFGKIRRYTLCSGVAAYYVVINYAVVWQHAFQVYIGVYAACSALHTAHTHTHTHQYRLEIHAATLLHIV